MKMNQTIDPQISKYIDATVDVAVQRSSQQFRKDMEHERGIITEGFRSDLKLMGETVDAKIREVTHEVFREEMHPFKEEMHIFREELKSLRKDTNRHGIRLTRLERATT